MRASRDAVLGLGSNLGSREALLRAARDLVANTHGIEWIATSRVYATEPVGPAGQPDYLNAALRVRTALEPEELLASTRAIEQALGRERRERWGARTLDLDLLFVDGLTLTSPTLTVPHPELTTRAFALAPLVELLPDATDPATGARYADLLAELPPPSPIAPRVLGDAFETEVLEHTADEGFVVHARDRADALAGAAEALAALVVNPASVRPLERAVLEIAPPEGGWGGDDERAFAWLAEVLYHVDARRLAVRRAVVFVDDATSVRGALFGEPLDESRHDVKGAIKAVTYHAMEIGPTDDGAFRLQVVVDV